LLLLSYANFYFDRVERSTDAYGGGDDDDDDDGDDGDRKTRDSQLSS